MDIRGLMPQPCMERITSRYLLHQTARQRNGHALAARFSMRELVRTNRISGLAFEPAWLAGQLATVFFPFLFASILTNFRLTSQRWLEPALLALSTLVLLATYSRGGLLITVGVTGLVTLFFGRDVLRGMWSWFIGGFRN